MKIIQNTLKIEKFSVVPKKILSCPKTYEQLLIHTINSLVSTITNSGTDVLPVSNRKSKHLANQAMS